MGVAVLILFYLLHVCSGQLQWVNLSPTGRSPAPREGHAFGYHHKTRQLIVFGGGVQGGVSDETWLYSLATNTWTQVNTNGGEVPSPRKYAFSGVIESLDIFVVALGIGAGGAEFGDIWVFNIANRNWTELNPTGDGISIRYGGYFGVHYSSESRTFWIGSGFTLTTDLASRYIDLYQLTFTSSTEAEWELVAANPSSGNQFNPLAPHGRCLQASAVVSENVLVMYGGCMRGGSGGGPCPTEDVWSFDDRMRQWTRIPACPTPRVWSAMAPLTNMPGKALMYGGSEKFSSQLISVVEYPDSEVFVIDAENGEWLRLHAESVNGSLPGRRFRHAMVAGENGVIYMFGGQNVDNSLRLNDLWMISGDVNKTTPLTPQCERVWFSYAHLHGLMMGVAWGLLLPLGFLIARYYKNSKKVWFVIHVTLQIIGVLMTIAAFVMIFPASSPVPSHPHAIIGIILTAIAVQQPINAIFRPHAKEGKKKKKRRICWEWYHKIMGVAGILIGFIQITLGVFLIISPLGVWITWICMMFLWVAIFAIHELLKWIRTCSSSKESEDEEHELKEKR